MTDAYDPEYRRLAHEAAERLGLPLGEGVYAAWLGPAFETPAEIRMLRVLGADLVGMSTVPEVLAARHMGIRCLALSCVTNAAAGVLPEPIDHEQVLAVRRARRRRPDRAPPRGRSGVATRLARTEVPPGVVAQRREHRQHAAVVVGRLLEAELVEDLPDVRLDRLRAEEERLADRPVRPPLGHQAEHLALAVGQLVERAALARALHEARDDRRVDDALALVDASAARRRGRRCPRRGP